MQPADRIIVDAQREVARAIARQTTPALVGYLLESDHPREIWAAYLKERPLVERYSLLRPDTPDPQDLRQEALAAGLLEVTAEQLAFRRLFPAHDVGVRLCTHLTGLPSLAGMLAMQEFTARRHVLGPHGWQDGLWSEVCAAFQERIAHLVGDDLTRGDVCWFGSTSDALHAVLANLHGKLVFTSGHFSTAHYIHHHWARARGGRLVEVPCDALGRVPTLRLLQAIDEGTSIVSIAHVLPRSGWVQDLAGIANVMADRCPDATLVLDVASSAGVLPLDVSWLPERTAIVGTGRTYLRAGPGVGFAWLSRVLLQDTAADRIGWWAHAAPADRTTGPVVSGDGAARLRTGTPPVRDLYALVAELGVLASKANGTLWDAVQLTSEDVKAHVAAAALRARELGLQVLGAPLGPSPGPLLAIRHSRALEVADGLAREHLEITAWPDVPGGNQGVLRMSGSSATLGYELLHAVERIAAL